jgi:hypothetical protein
VFSYFSAHCFGCSIGSPNGHVPRLSIYTCCTNSRNFLVSDTSWSAYLNLSMQPNRVGVAGTPSGMCGNTIEASGCLRGDRMMGFFPFLFTDVLVVPASGSLSSLPDSGFLVISSICTSSCCVDPTTGYGLGLSDSVLSLSPPFILWVASALEGCCEFPMANGSWPYALSCESISIPANVGACHSSSTSVALTGSTYGKGIVSTSMIPSLCVNSCSAFAVSCGDMRLLCVFHVVWLDASTFGGAIMGNSCFPY